MEKKTNTLELHPKPAPQYKIAVPTHREIGWGTVKNLVADLLKRDMFPLAGIWRQCGADVSRNEAICPDQRCFPELPPVAGVLCLDTDIVATVDQVLALEKKFSERSLDVLAGLYRKREDDAYCVSIYGDKSETKKLSGIIPVRQVGFGCAFIRTSLLAKIPKPWFHTEWTTVKNSKREEEWRLIPEDTIFCQKVIAVGGKVWCDFDVEVGHKTLGADALKAYSQALLDEVRPPENKT